MSGQERFQSGGFGKGRLNGFGSLLTQGTAGADADQCAHHQASLFMRRIVRSGSPQGGKTA